MEDKQKVHDCNLFNSCDAPICPLDPNRHKAIWFPDEAICRSTKHCGLKWIQNQRKIKKRAVETNCYFTLRMLDRDIFVRKGIVGINPDAPDAKLRQERWIRDHPGVSPETKERMRTRGKVMSDREANG